MRVVFSESCPNASLMTDKGMRWLWAMLAQPCLLKLDGASCHPADFLQLAVHPVRGVQVLSPLVFSRFLDDGQHIGRFGAVYFRTISCMDGSHLMQSCWSVLWRR